MYYIEVGDSIANDLLDDLTKSNVASIKEEYYDTGVEEPQKKKMKVLFNLFIEHMKQPLTYQNH